MKVAVVILNWNGKALLQQFLPSVVENSAEANIYVADNASEDDSVAFLKEKFPQVKIIQNKENGGFAKGYNDALTRVSEEIFILLNSDVEVSPRWLQPLIEEFQNSPETAAVQPKILSYRKKDFFEYAGAAGGFVDKFGYPFCRGRIFDELERDEGQYDDTVEVFWATGACMAIRKKDFLAAGGFDEDFFAHQEEIDLCWRLFNLDRKVKTVGASKIYHLGGGTLETAHPRKTFLNFRNSLYVLLKNAPGKQLYFLIFGRLLLDGLAGLKFLTEGKFRHTLAIVRAHFNFYGNFQKMLKKRGSLRRKENYYKKSSIVVDYYLLKKKKFTPF